MSEETKTIEPTRIKTVSVKISRQVDLGYVPYIQYLKKLGSKQPPFGTRDQSRVEYDIFLSAEIGTEADVNEVALDLGTKGKALIDELIANAHGAVAKEAKEENVPEEAFTISRTVVTREAVGDF